MPAEIPKVYSPQEIEPRWARYWIERQLYRPSDDAARPRFCLVIPPPNITGSLHMGHMLEHTEIDILMRWHRMRGEDVLWLPGTDHASIATQMIVERELGREALPNLEGLEAASAWQREGQRLRLAMGPEEFIARCWQWKKLNGDKIRRQMERLGASVDWTRARFTMDGPYTRAVHEVFVRLYEEGLIYRGKYIVNWCPRCGTAVSDLEVVHEERQGHLWTIRYPFEDGSGYLTVATTRPETMLGDVAVAVNPADPRYTAMIDSHVVLPLVGRHIPVIADRAVDPEFGTGAVKVTPAHDPNDYAMAVRHNQLRPLPSLAAGPHRLLLIDPYQVIDEHARMTDAAGAYHGMDRYEAREAVLGDLKAQGLLEKTENYTLSVGVCQRCKTVVEPLLSTQWFMEMQPLAGPALRAVEEGRIRIQPEQFRKIYLNWMENIHDWCISRQLWWGHRIPAWYCDACGEVIVAAEAPAACPNCKGKALRQDPDVLDTWFSSALWPFATLGWPERTLDLAHFYPNDLMIMGYDILFFWGARMVMMGLKFMGEAPFRELYVHMLVRDAERQKMSKTKGNVIDPLEVTEKYGTDAVRFALAVSAAPGTDIAFSVDKIEANRAFANKIWNAARFILMNIQKLPEPVRGQLGSLLFFDEADALFTHRTEVRDAHGRYADYELAHRWIFSRLAVVTREMSEALAAYRFHEAAQTIYHFFWHEFCDWYLEWIKPEIVRAPEEPKPQAEWVNLLRVFEASLRLLHPFMPFITEELWHQLPGPSRRVESLSFIPFGRASDRLADPVSENQFGVLQEFIVAVRNAKAEMGLQTEKPSVRVASDDLRVLELLRSHQETVERQAGLEAMSFTRGRLEGDGVRVISACEFRILYERAVDPAGERARVEGERQKIERQLAGVMQQLGNEAFVNRAPQHVVEGVRRRQAELAEHLRKAEEALQRLQ